jgi:hypothetical protein
MGDVCPCNPKIIIYTHSHTHTLITYSATGAGLSHCQYEEDCKNLVMPGNTTATVKTEEGDELNYDDHYVLMSTISTTTDSSIESLDLTELQEAVVAAVAEVQGASMDKDAVVVSTPSDDELQPKRHIYTPTYISTHNTGEPLHGRTGPSIRRHV